MMKKIVICQCGNPEHQIIINTDENESVLQIHLNNLNLFKRIVLAIKYIFGYKSKYGEFESVIITKENYNPFKEMIKKLEQ